jgi:hypothetical protein
MRHSRHLTMQPWRWWGSVLLVLHILLSSSVAAVSLRKLSQKQETAVTETDVVSTKKWSWGWGFLLIFPTLTLPSVFASPGMSAPATALPSGVRCAMERGLGRTPPGTCHLCVCVCESVFLKIKIKLI